MVLLAHLGFFHTPWRQIATISGDQVRKLHADRPAAPRFNLTIVGFDLPSLRRDTTKKTSAMLRHLQATANFGLSVGAIFDAWMPNDKELAGFSQAVAFADCERLKQLMTASIQNRYSPGDALTVIADREELSYADAGVRLNNAIAASMLVPQAGPVSTNLTKLRTAFRRDVTNPLRRSDSKRNPFGGMLAFASADIADTWFEYLDSVHAARKVLAGEHPGSQIFNEERFEKRLRLTREFARLYQLVLQERRQN
jgi:hypothetical protein